MEGLVEECLDFVAKRINDIVRLPIDMSCISGILLKKLASRIEIEDADKIKDKKDKLVSRLFMKVNLRYLPSIFPAET